MNTLLVAAVLAVGTDERAADLLSATVSDPQKLFPRGRVTYFIDTQYSPGEGVAPLKADDSRIASAVQAWMNSTCVQLSKCTSPTLSGCPSPRVVLRAHKSACQAEIGFQRTRSNYIWLASACSVGSVTHELGHMFGLFHEQSRYDRDSYVKVDLTAIKPGKEGNFLRNNNASLGAYDYGSIMHYPENGFRKDWRDTIISPYPIGNRDALSSTDKAAIDFLYDGCRAPPAAGVEVAPRCMASVDTSVVHLLPHSKTWRVRITVMHPTDDVTVDYAGSTTTAGTKVSATKGSTLSSLQWVTASLTPKADMAGQAVTIQTNFAPARGGPSVSCSVRIQVASADRVCFGLESTDPNVCSGHGDCVDVPSAPCKCHEGWTGGNCSEVDTCRDNVLWDFDAGLGVFEGIAGASLDKSLSVRGGALRATDINAVVPLGGVWLSRRITMFIGAATAADFTLEMRNSTSTCLPVWLRGGALWVYGQRTSTPFEPNRLYFIDIRFFRTGAVVFIDGKQLEIQVPESHCVGGSDTFSLAGSGWLESLHMHCSNFLIELGATEVTQQMVQQGGVRLKHYIVHPKTGFAQASLARAPLLPRMWKSRTSRDFGWNQLVDKIMPASDIERESATTLQVTLAAVPEFRAPATEVVGWDPSDWMFLGAPVPQVYLGEVAFRIVGTCTASVLRTFDTDADAAGLPPAVRINTAVKAQGAGSLELTVANELTKLFVPDTQPATMNIHIRRDVASSELRIVLASSGSPVELVHGSQGLLYRDTEGVDHTLVSPALTGAFQLVSVEFDWAQKTFRASLDGAAGPQQQLPDDMRFVSEVRVASSEVPAFADQLELPCETRDPSFTATYRNFGTECAPGKDGAEISINVGTVLPSVSDKLVLTEAEDCSGADAECTATGLCSTALGSLSLLLGKPKWDIPAFPESTAGKSYRVCYRQHAAGGYHLMEGSVAPCTKVTDTPPSIPSTDTPPAVATTPEPEGVPLGTGSPFTIPVFTLGPDVGEGGGGGGGSNKGGIIAGIVVGVVVLLAIAGGVAFFVLKKKTVSFPPDQNEQEMSV
eukprot:TRINITY_DN1026_c1_g1_i5.p1 TRINITY_DN1026_c1_g1~~TRINITY_DN1026_c1_g1_i5.p1  ORF type:complete len:1072 (+),score=388.08 TRINITY_DN1026_c1_g1_i5:55-3216(+)